MKIKFFTVADLDRNLKATIHRSGKLGFTKDAADKLQLKASTSANIGMNEEDPSDEKLYMVFYDNPVSGSFRVVKAGSYFYLSTKPLFDTLKYDYLNESISFDITRESQFEGQPVYALKRRKMKTKQSDDASSVTIDDDF
jgi:hypothetical protein